MTYGAIRLTLQTIGRAGAGLSRGAGPGVRLAPAATRRRAGGARGRSERPERPEIVCPGDRPDVPSSELSAGERGPGIR